MGIVAIGAFDVVSHGQGVLGGVVDPGGAANRMGGGFEELGGKISPGHGTVVTGKAVFLFGLLAQQSLSAAGTMRPVAAFAAGLANGVGL